MNTKTNTKKKKGPLTMAMGATIRAKGGVGDHGGWGPHVLVHLYTFSVTSECVGKHDQRVTPRERLPLLFTWFFPATSTTIDFFVVNVFIALS